MGARGQLGLELKRVFDNRRVISLTREQLDVTEAKQAIEVIGRHGPEVVINCTAFNRVDDAESDPADAFAVNAFGAMHVARGAAGAGARLIHVSTDYVFDGLKGTPYSESDVPRPLSAYGISKLAGEFFARAECEQVTIVRTSALYGGGGQRQKGGRGNFVEMVLRRASTGDALQVVNDQTTVPTYARDLAERIETMLARRTRGIYHVANAGQCTWFEFAQEIVAMAGLEAKVIPVTTDELAAIRGAESARRPHYSVLVSARWNELGLSPMRPWRDALAAYLQEREAAA